MWGLGGLQVHGIRSRRLLYKEVGEVRLNYKKSDFWWFGDPACVDSIGGTLTEEDLAFYISQTCLREEGRRSCVI